MNQQRVFAGIDLHSNNVMIGIVDENGRRLTHQKLGCDFNEIAPFLSPWKERLQSVAVESTYNWYWLVDGLRALCYPTLFTLDIFVQGMGILILPNLAEISDPISFRIVSPPLRQLPNLFPLPIAG